MYSTKTTEEKDELNLITLAQQYSDDDKVRELLESPLWPPRIPWGRKRIRGKKNKTENEGGQGHAA